MEFFQRNKGNSSLRPGGTRISPRINSRERREAVFVDGILGVDGIPIGIEGRGSLAEWEWEGREEIISSETHRRVSKMAKYRFFSATYLVILLGCGCLWQGVIWPF